MKIYTKTGDTGSTSLVGGQRVSKSHPRLEAYGTVDELNASLGLALSQLNELQKKATHWQLLFKVQHQLFNIGSRLACEDQKICASLPQVSKAMIEQMELQMDTMQSQTKELKEFILPGGSLASSYLHLSRTICRRAERNIIDLVKNQSLEIELKFLNRLSDYLFVAARFANHEAKVEDVTWKKEV